MSSLPKNLLPSGNVTLDGTFTPKSLPADEAAAGEGTGGINASTGGWIRVRDCTGWSIQITWTGTPSGNFLIEGSDDGVQADTISTQAAGGAAGHFLFERTAFSGVEFIRLNYGFTASTGTLTKAICQRQYAMRQEG